LTDLLAVVPNSTFVAVLPTANPVPVMVALVPPAFEPLLSRSSTRLACDELAWHPAGLRRVRQ
jgi:hypothetical protein